MKELDLQHLFYDSPYPVKLDDDDFITIIVPRNHPYLDEIIKHFDSEITMFRANKP